MSQKPPHAVSLHVAAALGPNGAAYAVRLESAQYAKTIEGIMSGTVRDAIAEGIVAALDELKYSSAVTIVVPAGESAASIRELLDSDEPKRAAARHRVEVRFDWPGAAEAELRKKARELAGTWERPGDGDEATEST